MLIPPAHFTFMKTKFLFGLTLGLTALSQTATHAGDLQGTRDVLDQWVETSQLISKEKSDWRLEKAILEDTLTLLTGELERLTKNLEELEASATAADEDRAQLTEQKEELEAGSAVVEENIGSLETQLKKIVKTLPAPLVEKLSPLIRRLPDDPEDTQLSLGERVQNIVGILSQTDKFNTTITLESEARELDSGKTVQVSTIYWGLAAAYYVDDSGTYAGIGYPTANGWEWPQVEDAGPQIKQLLEIYDGTDPNIQFVDLPASIK